MKGVGLVLAVCIVLVTASPHTQYVEQLKETLGGRFSDNIDEDARLDVPELVRKYGYPLEEHTVTTEDGYILTMHRIPHGRDANNVPDPNKPVVFVMHGILCSSAVFVLMGPGNGLGYILAEAGFDVWLGNARGNYYSRRHVRLNPDSIINSSFWNFSWDEIGNIDLPAMIDYALEYTQKEKLHYIGHSQGTTTFFVMGSLRPEYNEKIISMQALAPVAYMAHNRNLLFNILAPHSKSLSIVGSMIGLSEFLPNSQIMSWAGQNICRDEVVFQPICTNILFLLLGWSEQQLNTTMFPVMMGHVPAGSSIFQIVHYAQGIVDEGFRRYDHGTIQNLRRYGRINPPSYDLSKVTAPVFLHYTINDPLAELPDVRRLAKELGNPIGMFRVPLATFSHLDFMFGIDAKTLVYNRVINLIRTMDSQSFPTIEVLDARFSGIRNLQCKGRMLLCVILFEPSQTGTDLLSVGPVQGCMKG